MTSKTLTVSILLATSFLLLTGCNDNAKTETNTTTDTNTIIDNSNNDNPTEGSGDGDDNTTTPPTVTPISLMLTIDKTSLNKDENTSIKVIATYADGTSKDMTEQVEWVMTPKDAVKVTEKTLIAKKDNPTTLKAKLGNTLSNTMNLNITWVVNGHTLPPEPDKTINDSTLLGIDSNDNGVRDDVERWIYETYKDKHPVHIDVAMQAGRGYKQVLKTPEKAKEIREMVNSSIHCNWYYKGYAEFFNEPLLMKRDINPSVFGKYFNTEERKDIYWQYDGLLSGDSYTLPDVEKLKEYCDFDTSKYNKQ